MLAAVVVDWRGFSKVRSTAITASRTSILTALRFLCRIRYTKNLGFDDYSIAVALVVAITLGVMNGFHISYGAG